MTMVREYTARSGTASASSNSPGSQCRVILVHHVHGWKGHFQDKEQISTVSPCM